MGTSVSPWKEAKETLCNDVAREKVDAELLGEAAGSFQLQELRWSRELAGLAAGAYTRSLHSST
jgi:hypothetical protein